MGKLGMRTAAIYSRTSLQAHTGLARHVKQRELSAPVKIETEDVRWFAVCTAPACERRVSEDLTQHGFRTYCPLGQKFIYFQSGKRTKQRIIKQFPLLSRYIFAGAFPGMVVSRHASERIHSVLGDREGPITIPAKVIAHVNDLELDGKWDETKFRPEASPFVRGVEVRLIEGPLSGFPATVDALESESRLRVLVRMFGRVSSIVIEPCYAEAV